MLYTNEMIKKKKDKKIRRKKLFQLLFIPIILIIILSVIYIGYMKLIKKEKNIDFLGFKQYIVMTGSMEPSYDIGDLVIVKKVKEDDIKINDVITYSIGDGGDTISHRVIEIINGNDGISYRTKGDNNNSVDENLVSYNQVQGKIIGKIKGFGKILNEIIVGPVAILVIIFALLMYSNINTKEEKRITRENARKKYNIPRYKKEESV